MSRLSRQKQERNCERYPGAWLINKFEPDTDQRPFLVRMVRNRTDSRRALRCGVVQVD
jgi:hypothetical protein